MKIPYLHAIIINKVDQKKPSLEPRLKGDLKSKEMQTEYVEFAQVRIKQPAIKTHLILFNFTNGFQFLFRIHFVFQTTV